MRRIVLKVAILTLVAGVVVRTAEFKSTWKSPDAVPGAFAGKKIAAVVITDDQGLQMSAEEALARNLTERGMQGVAAYRVIPKEELKDKDKAKGWFERAKIAGAVVMRVVNAEREVTYTPSMWATSSYSTMWSYYGYGWGTTAVFVPGGRRENSFVTVETLIFDVPKDKLLWASVSQMTNPAGTQRVVREIVGDIAAEMQKTGFVSGGK